MLENSKNDLKYLCVFTLECTKYPLHIIKLETEKMIPIYFRNNFSIDKY